ncbi:SDR family NAD(P)-dependent oxidoreductase [Rhizobium rhizogenes]|jgi:NAD(P)-dependent dehydrogenase (short-subunit alcohol dehydrogenase family)|uniref:SDR family NAD(P)-dependent oxidoreductase n=1 Tax=Rhizobium rhizogenes TaxID=359 RepID=UPI0004D5EB00|nr:SDR family NAD(P)-dependent oxidoreductase [Rhizobium rhizogenes]KEA09337.1 short-chain dehydrogenase [Rhizobium rhizogenes]MQB35176.1 SDR family NAD(P)-dependent oxidoreductase [Rhizobium rhizogenes]NTF70732.1 SDR family NAD(P)-dependent oxidoreductase [Rhizobium rhizogenes]NTG45229.1 SDR family NAD(P)-dependent oxidoreductase [Rhizobium rhizogenes]NTI82562.1 SDR family NAD(P)-dependent oxidoreductase [Rhizobium rhizogenes]
MTDMKKIWFITGAARGFGLLWARAALERGDNVAVTARNTDALAPLVEQFGDAVLPISLDVTDRQEVFDAVGKTHQKFGRLDVVLSNAGYGHQGAVEEITEAQARAQIDTNLFGTMWVAQAALPILREQKSGHIIAVSSVLGVFAIPNFGIYNASKFAVEGLLDALSQEVASLGINVTLIEPAGYATDFNNPSSAKNSAPNPAYQGVRDGLAAAFANYVMGNPAATPAAILKLVDSPKPPLRLALGSSAVGDITGVYQNRLSTWESWQDVSAAAQG